MTVRAAMQSTPNINITRMIMRSSNFLNMMTDGVKRYAFCVLRLNIIFAQAAVKGGTGKSQFPGCTGNITLVFFNDFQYGVLLDGTQGEIIVFGSRHFLYRFQRRKDNVFGPDLIPFTHDHRSFNTVLQFPHVAGEMI